MKIRPWLVGTGVFAGILSLHIFFGSTHIFDPARVSGWIDHVGSSFDVAVVRATETTPLGTRAPASVTSDVKHVPGL